MTEAEGRPALEIVAANCCVPPGCTDAEAGETETETSLITVIEADALLVGSLALVAAIVSLEAGKICGAAYVPAEEIVPSATFPPASPSTLQVIAEFVAFATVAENCIVDPSSTDPPGGEILTVIAAGGAAPDVGGGAFAALELPPPNPPQPLAATAASATTAGTQKARGKSSEAELLQLSHALYRFRTLGELHGQFQCEAL